MYTMLFLLAVATLPLGGKVGAVFLIVMLPMILFWLWRAFEPATNTALWGRAMFGVSLLVLLALCVMLAVATVLP
jgi:heme O synthase-like polyprenyltransferase